MNEIAKIYALKTARRMPPDVLHRPLNATGHARGPHGGREEPPHAMRLHRVEVRVERLAERLFHVHTQLERCLGCAWIGIVEQL